MLLEICSDLHQNLLQKASALLLDHKFLTKTIDLPFTGGCLALCSLRGTRNDTDLQSTHGRLRLRLCRSSKIWTLGC